MKQRSQIHCIRFHTNLDRLTRTTAAGSESVLSRATTGREFSVVVLVIA